MKTLTLLLLAALSLPAATFYVNIAGLGGEPDYAQRFKMWADDIDGSLKKAGGDANVTTMNAPHLEQVRVTPHLESHLGIAGYSSGRWGSRTTGPHLCSAAGPAFVGGRRSDGRDPRAAGKPAPPGNRPAVSIGSTFLRTAGYRSRAIGATG